MGLRHTPIFPHNQAKTKGRDEPSSHTKISTSAPNHTKTTEQTKVERSN